jgi:hypothetical protein
MRLIPKLNRFNSSIFKAEFMDVVSSIYQILLLSGERYVFCPRHLSVLCPFVITCSFTHTYKHTHSTFVPVHTSLVIYWTGLHRHSQPTVHCPYLFVSHTSTGIVSPQITRYNIIVSLRRNISAHISSTPWSHLIS